MWPRRTYARPPRLRRLNSTPPPGPSPGLPEAQLRGEPAGPKGKLQMKILPKLKENIETTQLNESTTIKHSMQLNVAQQTSPINEDSKNTNSLALKESMTDDDLQGESNPLNTQISSGITSSDDFSLSLLRSSDTDFCLETTSFEDSLNSFPSPEIFREGEFLDINNSSTEGYINFKNSTLLDTSRAMAIENMEQFSNLSTILDNSICKVMPEIKKTPDTKTKTLNSILKERLKPKKMNKKKQPKKNMNIESYYEDREDQETYSEEDNSVKIPKKKQEVVQVQKELMEELLFEPLKLGKETKLTQENY